MAAVSIGQVENLSRAVAALGACAQAAVLECEQRVTAVEQKQVETEAALNEASRAVERAEEEVSRSEDAVTQAEIVVTEAGQEVSAAESDLEAARQDGEYDDDGNFIPAVTRAEEAALAEAEAALRNAETVLEEARQNLTQAVHRLDTARQKAQIAAQNNDEMRHLVEDTRRECQARIAAIEARVAEGNARLERARAALEAYLTANPEARALYDWLHWQPPPNQPVMPQSIHDRLNLTPEQRRLYIQYLTETDPAFRQKIAAYRECLANANGPAERDAIFTKMSRNLSGELAEKLVKNAFGPLGTDVETHVRYEIKNGKITFTDIVISGLKEPVILGKGAGMAAPKGGAIAIEVKTGHKRYLKEQKEHMETQAEGHKQADASVVLCSRNIKDLSPEEEAELRAALKASGSPILAMLPEKDDIDGSLWAAIQGA
jgi:hypothetical protein